MRRFLCLFLLNINYLQCQNTLKTVQKKYHGFWTPYLTGWGWRVKCHLFDIKWREKIWRILNTLPFRACRRALLVAKPCKTFCPFWTPYLAVFIVHAYPKSYIGRAQVSRLGKVDLRYKNHAKCWKLRVKAKMTNDKWYLKWLIIK